MARQPNIFENYFKNSLIGRGLSYLQDQQRPPGYTEDVPKGGRGSYTAPSLPESAGNMSSEGLADVRASGARPFAGSGITVDRSPVEDAPGYTSSINSIGNFIIRDPGGNIIYGSGNWVSDRDYQAFKKAQEAAKEKEETTSEVDEAADKVEEISEKTFDRGAGTGRAGTGTAAGAQAEYTKAKAESVGQAEDEAIEMIKKGRRATILTKPSGLLGSGEEEGKTRRRRALIGR